MTKEEKSPYLATPSRLADVIAAIQVMGNYKFYKLPFDGWADRICGDSSRADYWRRVFEEHPEFFRLDGSRKKASLVWRRQYPRRFHVDLERKLSQTEHDDLPEKERDERLSRNPLTPTDIKTLIDTATGMHSRAVELQRERRWWLPVVSALAGLIGVVLGAWLK